jgi:polyisoprenoid-binding protein YceI
MNISIAKAFAVSTLCFSISTPLIAQETYTLDPMHTYVLWHIDHFGFSKPSGKWMADGTLSLDKEKMPNSKVNVTIKLADLVTGIPKLDAHLKSKDFLDVAQFPTATFVSDKVDSDSDDNKKAKVQGMLTVHGVTKPVTLDVTFNKMGKSPITNKETVGFTAKTQLKRSDFGISAYLPGLGDNVNIEIEGEAYQ